MPNLYIFIIAIAIAVWFRGINNILTHFLKKDTLISGILLCVFALAIFLLDDGSLSELYNVDTSKNAAAGTAAYKN